MGTDPRAGQVEAALEDTRAHALPPRNEIDPVTLQMPHLERSMKIIQRYADAYSDVPFDSSIPLLGPLIILGKNLARRVLRTGLSAGFGSQAEFNAAVGEILFEFTRRAALSQNLPDRRPGKTTRGVPRAPTGNEPDPAPPAGFDAFTQELVALRESVRAANLSATEAERQVIQLRQEIERFKRTNPLQ